MTSSITIDMTTFALILLKTSRTPFGLRSFIQRNKSTKNASNHSSQKSSVHIFLIGSAIAFRSSLSLSPYSLEVKGFLHPSASRPEGTEPPFVLCAAFKTSVSSIASYSIELTCWIGPVIMMFPSASFPIYPQPSSNSFTRGKCAPNLNLSEFHGCHSTTCF